MSRSLSAVAKAALAGTHCDEVFVHLVEISHAGFPSPGIVRLCNDSQNLTHGGNVYTSFGFDVGLLNEQADNIPRPTITLDNVDQSLTQRLELVNTPSDVVHRVVLASQPDTEEVPAISYKLRDVQYNFFQIAGVLSLALLENDRVPFNTINSSTAPGAFGALST